MKKLKWKYNVRSLPTRRLTAIAIKSVWEKATKGPAGIWWDNVVNKVWKEIGGSQEEIVAVNILWRRLGGTYKAEGIN